MNIFWFLGISLLVQVIFFIFAAWFKTDKVTDLSYGLSFLILAMFTGFSNIIIFAMIALWSLRIAGFLFWRILKTKKDERFNGVRENFLKFARFWFLQAITVWVIMLPALFLLMAKNLTVNIFLVMGIIIWMVGFFFETVADFQKSAFKDNPENKDKLIMSGLWSLSRHPNYFGEMTMWWAIFLIALPYLSGWNYLVVVGPIWITFILRFVTGIPPLEKKYSEKFANDQAYMEYKSKTKLLVPFIY